MQGELGEFDTVMQTQDSKVSIAVKNSSYSQSV